MGDRHAYGVPALLSCVSRRVFVMAFCFAMILICGAQVVRWIAASGIFDLFMGSSVAQAPGCAGTRCYEVWTCYGFKDTTQNFREPWSSVVGLFFFLLGLLGTHHGNRWMVRWFANFLAFSFAAHLALVVADLVYIDTCSAYPTNLVQQTLVSRLPPMPVAPGTQDILRAKTVYPVAETDVILGSFNAVAWYVCMAGLWVLFLGYAAYETRILAELVERGPLGLGVHYGLAQWGETLDDVKAQMREMPAAAAAVPHLGADRGLLWPSAEAPSYGATAAKLAGAEPQYEASWPAEQGPEHQLSFSDFGYPAVDARGQVKAGGGY